MEVSFRLFSCSPFCFGVVVADLMFQGLPWGVVSVVGLFLVGSQLVFGGSLVLAF